MTTTLEQLETSEAMLTGSTEEGLSRRVTISFTLTTYQKHYTYCLKKKAVSAKFEGFRVGKAPLNMVEARYQNELHQEALNQTIEAAIFEHLEKNAPLLASSPRVVSELKNDSEAQKVLFDLEYEILPTIKLKVLAHQEFIIPSTKIPNDRHEILLQDFLQTRASAYEDAQNGARERDQVTFSMSLTADTPEKEVSSIVRHWLTTSHTRMIPAEKSLLGLFEPALISSLVQSREEFSTTRIDSRLFIGVKKGDKIETTLKLERGELPVILTVQEIQSPVMNPLTPQDLKKLGCSDQGPNTLERFLCEQCHLQTAIFRRYKFKQAIMERLEAAYSDVPLPKNFLMAALARLEVYFPPEDGEAICNTPATSWSKAQQELYKLAYKKAMPDLLLSALRARYNVQVDASEVQSLISQSERAMKQRGFSVTIDKNSKQAYADLMQQYVLEEKIVQLIESNVICQEPEISFEEFLTYAATGIIPESALKTEEVLEQANPAEDTSPSKKAKKGSEHANSKTETASIKIEKTRKKLKAQHKIDKKATNAPTILDPCPASGDLK